MYNTASVDAWPPVRIGADIVVTVISVEAN